MLLLNPAIKPLIKFCAVVVIVVATICVCGKLYDAVFHKGSGVNSGGHNSVVVTPAHNPTADVKKVDPSAKTQVDVSKPVIHPGYDTEQHVCVNADGNTVTVNVEKMIVRFRCVPEVLGGYSIDGLVGGIGLNVFTLWRLNTDLFMLTNLKTVAIGAGESFNFDNNLAIGAGTALNSNLVQSLLVYMTLKL